MILSDRGVSVMLGHKTDMMDNHYQTSMSVK